MEAKIVIGLQFGDEGKGRTVDWLCEESSTVPTCCIRFSGGQQAGHTVIYRGIKHIFKNFCSGTLKGVPSYFSEHTTIYLPSIEKEMKVLTEKGITPDLTIHPLAKVTTPYDIAYGRIREESKGHGSCGMGIGSTMKRSLETPYKLYAIDLLNPTIITQKIHQIRNYYLGLIDREDREDFYGLMIYLEERHFYDLLYKKMFDIQGYGYLTKFDKLVFEGSQGIMLDAEHGVFPHVTYANTTSKNALDVINQMNEVMAVSEIHEWIDDIEVYYVTRCYQTRHGNGWMSNETPIELVNNQEEINVDNKWQGRFRIGELDYNLLNHSLRIDNIYSHGLKKHLVVTCLDQRPGFNFNVKELNTRFNSGHQFESPTNDVLKNG